MQIACAERCSLLHLLLPAELQQKAGWVSNGSRPGPRHVFGQLQYVKLSV
jgi:hypothetical protein